MRPFSEYAQKEYDNFTKAEGQRLRNKFNAEAEKQGLKGPAKGSYTNPKCGAFKKERENQRDAAIMKRAEALKTEIPEAIKNCKTVEDLPACANDVSAMLNFSIEVLGV